jgi:Domain of unknown function (DUF4304)
MPFSPAELLFQNLLKNLRSLMNEEGFRRHGQNFVRESDECWGVINFQKSQFSDGAKKTFTINVGIAAKRVLAYYGKPVTTFPPEYQCHWRERLGLLMPEGRDIWWAVSPSVPMSAVEEDVSRALVELAAPFVRQHLSESGLDVLWNSNTPGSFEYPRLTFQSVLAAIQGKTDLLPELFSRIRKTSENTTAAPYAEKHVAELRRRFSTQKQ